MDITLLFVEDCPHTTLVRERIAKAAAQLEVDVLVTERVVRSEAEAAAMGFRGSPTILLDGTDRFPTDDPKGLACRRYLTESGPEGAPSVQQLVEVLGR